MYGLESTIMLPLQLGWMLHGHQPAFPADLRSDLLALTAPGWLMTTPVHLRAYAEQLESLPGLEGIISATMPLAPIVADTLERVWSVPIHEVYGCTEGGMLAGRRTATEPRWTLCRHLVLREKDGAAWVSGGHVGSPIRLPDRISVHNRSEFTLHGRVDDLIKIAGKRMSLSALNLVLTNIPGVQDGIFCPPNECSSGLQRLIAIVVAPGMTKRDILHGLRAHLDPVFLPRPLLLVDAIPRNGTGKLSRAGLIDFARTLTGLPGLLPA